LLVGHQVDGEEDLGQRNLQLLEHRTARHARLGSARPIQALYGTSALQATTTATTALRTTPPVRPPSLDDGSNACLLSGKAVCKL
jgi:hypothetical protein